MSGTRCKRCELLIGMGCACPSRKKKQGGKRSGSGGRRRQEQPQPVMVRRIPKSKTRQGGKQSNPAPRPPRDDAFPYGDDREAEAFREELRDITERGSSVRTVSGGLPTLGRRR
ncbi:hypothetical protein [Streptomyces xinghaiensis]|uniref:hypothetical protein n=1 Tax=Streptomyces xinghaiensis TaxID=1038928 RepID=UPI0012FF95F3|nr:hypothetical protein [Streptomyces xinghaiensis]MZE77899.1 hypothetical protein [Streptomyces sp. SID5475]